MTEQEWLTCRNPDQMFQHLRETKVLSERKLRLFAVACCNRVGRWFTDPALEAGLDVAERFADGRATVRALLDAGHIVEAVSRRLEGEAIIASGTVQDEDISDASFEAANAVGQALCLDESDCPYVSRMRDISIHVVNTIAFDARTGPWDRPDSTPLVGLEREALASLVREVFGNPFRDTTVTPFFLEWNDQIVAKLARGAYEDRAFDRLPILGDALDEAGHDDDALLAHLRGPGPHVRGCWALDLLLGKP